MLKTTARERKFDSIFFFTVNGDPLIYCLPINSELSFIQFLRLAVRGLIHLAYPLLQ